MVWLIIFGNSGIWEILYALLSFKTIIMRAVLDLTSLQLNSSVPVKCISGTV